MHILSTPIDYLKGVGPIRADLLKKELGIFTYNDLLQHYPFRYIDKSKLHHISELKSTRVEKVEDVLKIGEKIKVKLVKIDDNNRLNFSIKALEEKQHG